MKSPACAAVEKQFAHAAACYADWGINASAAIDQALSLPLSLHCWQADDVVGLENRTGVVGGGILATGNAPGRARNGDEMRADLDFVLNLLPGAHRLNLHALYAETGSKPVERDALTVDHFAHWIAWAKARRIGLDFNTTFFAHPKADSGFTLSNRDSKVRSFWVRHGQACRRIATSMGRQLGSPCTLNHWIPDGAKDSPADRWSPRKRLADSLDRILGDNEGVSAKWCVDAVESKLFGIGSEDYVVGSAEFYSSYALSRGIVYCLDMGHFHPTETIHDKLSAYLQFHEKLLIHVSRPLRWDSDHVVLFNDDLRNLFLEMVRGGALDRVLLAMDFFDASINRTAAYIIGARAARKAMLFALLDPSAMLKEQEQAGRGAHKLALMEEAKTLPFDAVWNMLCLQAQVPLGACWLDQVDAYNRDVLAQRT